MAKRLRRLYRRVWGREQIDHIDVQLTDTHALLRDAERSIQELRQALDETQHQLADRLLGLDRSVQRLEGTVSDRLMARMVANEVSMASVVRQLAWLDPPPSVSDGPLVTVVLATWQRAASIGRAIESLLDQTYANWECIVVDDGSDDGTDEVMKRWLGDARIRYNTIDHIGAPGARNHGIDLTTGEILTYLDTDNTWHPTHLARVVDALADNPDAEWVLSGQLVVDTRSGEASVRNVQRPLDSLIDENHCDLNAVAHRRATLAEIGPFDPGLLRLSDWDLVLRLVARGAPVQVDSVTSTYWILEQSRISDVVPLHHYTHLVRARHRALPHAGLRVLLAEWHHPQLTETYIAAMISGLVRLGADVEVWSETDVAAPYPSPIPVRRGTLSAAIEAFGPDLVVTHWLTKGLDLRPVVRSHGLPHVVVAHGFEYRPELVADLLQDPDVVVHTFPHLVDPSWATHPRVALTVTCFDDTRFTPSASKDRRLVVRTSAGLLTKDLDTFLIAASLCPDHRFVLVLGHALLVEERTEIVIERARELGSPAEIRVDVPHDEVAALVSGAGIYLHTHGTEHPVTMPMSIAEAMATGCWVLGRDLPGMADYIGRAGQLYAGDTSAQRAAAAAELIAGSVTWDDATWDAQAAASVDQAFQRHASRDVVDGRVRSWRRAFDLPRRH